MKNEYSLWVCLLVFSNIPSQVFANEEAVSTEARVEQVLIAPQMGRWQMIGIPQEWVSKYWAKSKYQSLYIALRGPHSEDLAEYTPCNAPSRLLVGTEDQDGNRKEHLLTCLHTCSAKDNAKKVYRDLWARNTHLEGITAQLLVDGHIEIVEHYIPMLGLDRKRIRDIGVVEKNRYGNEKRLRTHRFSVIDLKKAVMQKADVSCLDKASP